jgi:Holliday junction DNA helicase RuvB
LGHVLLAGPAGLGKTTLARLLAAERGAAVQEVVGAHLEDPHQLISLLARMEKGGVLFVDEIHALGTACEEALYSALEDGLVQAVVRDRVRARVIRVRLEPFTLVGATTRLGADVSAEAALAVARLSRGTPREAIRLLERARDLAQVEEMEPGVVHHVGGIIQFSHVVHGAQRLGIDARGLSREERAVVRLLIDRGRPMGLEAIASRLGLDLDTWSTPFRKYGGIRARLHPRPLRCARSTITPILPSLPRLAGGIATHRQPVSADTGCAVGTPVSIRRRIHGTEYLAGYPFAGGTAGCPGGCDIPPGPAGTARIADLCVAPPHR